MGLTDKSTPSARGRGDNERCILLLSTNAPVKAVDKERGCAIANVWGRAWRNGPTCPALPGGNPHKCNARQIDPQRLYKCDGWRKPFAGRRRPSKRSPVLDISSNRCERLNQEGHLEQPASKSIWPPRKSPGGRRRRGSARILRGAGPRRWTACRQPRPAAWAGRGTARRRRSPHSRSGRCRPCRSTCCCGSGP